MSAREARTPCPLCGRPNTQYHTVDECRIAQGKQPYPKGNRSRSAESLAARLKGGKTG
jgi:hypothetical protein